MTTQSTSAFQPHCFTHTVLDGRVLQEGRFLELGDHSLKTLCIYDKFLDCRPWLAATSQEQLYPMKGNESFGGRELCPSQTGALPWSK